MKSMKPLLARVEAALFDLDGTLVETNIDFPLMKREMITLAQEQGLDPQALARLDILAIVGRDDAFSGLPRRSRAIRSDFTTAQWQPSRRSSFDTPPKPPKFLLRANWPRALTGTGSNSAS